MSNSTSKRVAINIVSLIAVFLMMAAAAMMQSGRFFGNKIQIAQPSAADSALTVLPDGSVEINTSSIGAKITGYAGPVPVMIHISANGIIDSISTLENAETPGFFKRVLKSGVLEAWNGLTPQQAIDKQVDAVSGATYSSTALIQNVKTGLEAYSPDIHDDIAAPASGRDAAFYCALAVLLAAMIVPLFTKNKRYRLVQQLLNAGVLGFWTGTFVNYTMLLGIVSGGVAAVASVIPLLMLITAFIYPIFGKSGYYCAWVCPLGSLQELASRCNPKHHLSLSPAAVKALTTFRTILWGALMLCLWTGLWLSWIDYEIFSAFLVEQAATGVLIVGALFVVLAIWVPRPYCRFVCPTGTLLRISQSLDNK